MKTPPSVRGEAQLMRGAVDGLPTLTGTGGDQRWSWLERGARLWLCAKKGGTTERPVLRRGRLCCRGRDFNRRESLHSRVNEARRGQLRRRCRVSQSFSPQVERVLAAELSSRSGSEATLAGWLLNRRELGGVTFLVFARSFRNGSSGRRFSGDRGASRRLAG